MELQVLQTQRTVLVNENHQLRLIVLSETEASRMLIRFDQIGAE
jgi:hypothetical protein